MADVHVKFMGESVTVREFTVDDIEAIYEDDFLAQKRLREWDAEQDGPVPVVWFNRVFDREMVSLKMVELATGLSAGKITAERPSDLRVLVDAVREANPDFFAMMETGAGLNRP